MFFVARTQIAFKKAIKIKNYIRKEEEMKKEKNIYSRAELEVIILPSDDIICTSTDPDDMENIPGGDSWA